MDIFSLIERVTDHLLEQNERSTLRPNSSACAYRGLKGRMCAVGVLIPDELYQERFEDKTVSGLRDFPVFWLKFMDHLESKFPSAHRSDSAYVERVLTKLQNIHDHHSPDNWERLLDDLRSDI